MRFDPELAEFRFGYGLSPTLPAPADARQMLQRLMLDDAAAERFVIPGFSSVLDRMQAINALRRKRRKSQSDKAAEDFLRERRKLVRQMRRDQLIWMGATFARRAWTRDAFRERLVAFWANHFTVRGKGSVTPWAVTPYIESTIRPHLTGTFSDILKSAIKSPLMLQYLDQRSSRGPGSEAAQRMGGQAGLNENLARELLELHTLGVDGPYTQTDVRELAELLTGLTFHPSKGTRFNKKAVEPGFETVLGKRYGGDPGDMADIDAVLEDLAVHPATAKHIGRKLAVHFVSDTPSPDLVEALQQSFSETGGDLIALYETLLYHPSSWDPSAGNIRPPLDWVSAVIRALAVPPARLTPAKNDTFFNRLPEALARMGQPYEQPPGPDGWPEEDAGWLTPQALAARLQWAIGAPQLMGGDLPDPRVFVNTALGTRVHERLRFAAHAAETRADGIGLILVSPEFLRS
ncbi:DUF1800 domain-containing protein [Primorskyibacter aestuariivivens]|uniref:DUF1800 domain-containing protein n=1 Tax=Primorskyibacter aestuariivivens TaxID=1888912 RepID=UPI0023012E0C|nr:DUF1800 domain-containing protein [Primorskyibacter aestuariivivens]MDA7429603.1 DUF1800 domain-containing protein [Primorskyibacter aestuariivivens]